MPGRNSPCVITCDPHAAAMMDQKCDGGGGGGVAAAGGVGGGLVSYGRGRGGTEVIIKPRSPAVVQVSTGGYHHGGGGGVPSGTDACVIRSPPGGRLPGPAQQQAPPSRNGCSTLFSDIAGVKRLRPDDWLAVNSPPASSPGTSSHISYTVISNGGSGGGGGYNTSPMSTTNSYDPYSPMGGKNSEYPLLSCVCLTIYVLFRPEAKNRISNPYDVVLTVTKTGFVEFCIP